MATLPSPIDPWLPPASGVIQPQEGPASFFQFSPVSDEDKNQALRAAAVRAAQFDLGVRQAREKAEDDELVSQILLNSNVKDAEKTVESARRFQGVRQYQREREQLLASGVPEADAEAQAMAKYAPMMFAGSPATIERAMRSATPVRFGKSPLGGVEYAIDASGGFHPLRDPNAMTAYQEEALGLRQEAAAANAAAVQLRNNLALARETRLGIEGEEKLLSDTTKYPEKVSGPGIFGAFKKQPNPERAKIEERVKAAKSKYERLMNTEPGTEAATPEALGASETPTSQALGPGWVIRKSDNARKWFKGNRSDLPADKFDIVE